MFWAIPLNCLVQTEIPTRWKKLTTCWSDCSQDMCIRAKSFQLCPSLYHPMNYSPPGSSVHGILHGKNTGVGYHALLQGIFWTQGLILYLLFSALAGRLCTWEAQINTTSHPGDAPGSNQRSHTFKACTLPLSYIRPQAEAGTKD